MMRKTVGEETGRRRGAGAYFLLAVSFSLSAMIVWNALFGQVAKGPGTLRASDVPPGASTRLDVVAKTDGQTTITLRYDPAVEAAQRELKQAGYYTGTVDGVAGSRTREAVIAWQRAAGMATTGEVTDGLVEHMRYTRQVAAASAMTNSISPAEAPHDTTGTAARRTDTARIMQVQAALADLGYEPGAADGTMSEDTRAAILKFEMDRGLAMEGKVSDALLAELAKPAPAAP
ncbi:MAG TPA: peptidoglycan-binding domain-containing protein [Aestuariivirga sp.]|nr:peptidoglycan-binding domain-containing protein [Aestuariivirga sp.]